MILIFETIHARYRCPDLSSCESLMIAGIDTEAMFARAAPLGLQRAFRGGLWPSVPV